MKRINFALIVLIYGLANGLAFSDDIEYEDKESQETQRILDNRAMDELEMIIIEDEDMPGVGHE